MSWVHDPRRSASVERFTYRHGLVAAGLFAAGALTTLWINDSPLLPAAHADSVQYMEAGASLAEGRGLQIPFASWASQDSVSALSHFPPGLPVVIGSLMKVTGVRSHVAALWSLALAAGLALAFVFLVGAGVGGWGVGLLSAALLLLMPPFVLAHAAIWSEPLYVACLLALLFAITRAPDKHWLAGLLGAAAVLIRYLGVAAVAGLGIWTYLRTRNLRKALISVGPGTVAFVGWSLWTRWQGESVRSPGEFDVGLADTLTQLPGAIQFWLAPGLPLVVGLLLLVGVGFAFYKAPRSVSVPAFVLLAAHLLVIVFSRLVVDARIPFDARMLFPVFALAMAPVAASLWKWRVPGLAVAVAWGIFAANEDRIGVKSLKENGSFYSSNIWIASDLVYWVDNRSEGVTLYSNEPGMMMYQSGRYARTLPLVTEDFQEFVAVWEDRPGAIVLVPPLRQDEFGPEAYLEHLDVSPVVQGEQGIVLMPGGGD
jgi:hypothetical protein